MKFLLGTCQPDWLERTAVPLFVSWRRLHERKTFPRAIGEWDQDSGGFIEVSKHGDYTASARQYASDTWRHSQEIGNLGWAAIQDWMCEPFVLKRTGLTLAEHQRRTIVSYHELNAIQPAIRWTPVIQGWDEADYLRHVDQYVASGVDLTALPLVGIGSICRRQGTQEAARIIRRLSADGIALHGFGFKMKGLETCGDALASSDSMSWSITAWRDWQKSGRNFCGGTHNNCANCLQWALEWRRRLLERIEGIPPHPYQLSLGVAA